ncbi:MAG TPA: thiamine phosphate synthase [Terriglobales bacterium]|nr:thiamine phosphate synthase [Terriglobales bacterium]
MTLDPFYPIVDSAAWVTRLVPLGIKLIQLRIKGMAEGPLRMEIRRAEAICTSYGCQLVVNDHWKLAIEEGCSFVHLGQEDLGVADVAAIRRAGLKLGISTHDDAELTIALAAEPDYVALGPIYPTVLKKMKWAPQGLERLADWKQRVGQVPLVAIGGLTLDRLPGIFRHGADSAAVVTDICRNPDPEARTRDWIAMTRQLCPRILA